MFCESIWQLSLFSIFLTTHIAILHSLPTSIFDIFSWEATAIYLAWMVYHVAMERILPGLE